MQEENTTLNGPDLLFGNNLEIDEPASAHLKKAGYWAKAAGIFMISIITLLILVFTGFSDRIGRIWNSDSEVFPVMLIIVAIIICILLTVAGQLIRFHKFIKHGITFRDSRSFERGIYHLKVYFIIIGIICFIQSAYYLTTLFKRW